MNNSMKPQTHPSFTALIKRDLRLSFHKGGGAFMPLMFFVLACALFPLGLSPDAAFLRMAAPGLLMIAAMLSALLPSERLFESDLSDGSLAALNAGGMNMALYAGARITSCFIASALPMLCASPLLALMLGMDLNEAARAPIALIPACALLLLIGALGASLAAGAKGGAALLALLVMPLYIPVLIFGAAALSGNPSALLFLYAGLSLALPLAPLASGAILKSLDRS